MSRSTTTRKRCLCTTPSTIDLIFSYLWSMFSCISHETPLFSHFFC
jgi:hypothetical protein